MAAVFAANKASKKIKKSTLGKVPKSCRRNNMDLAKAMGIMGFTSNRWAEKTKGKNPKDELDKAQFAKLMQIQKKKVRRFFRLISICIFKVWVSGFLGKRIERKR